MDIIVDTNIVFSAILNSTGKIGQLLTVGSGTYSFYSIDLLKKEIDRHLQKLENLSGLTSQQLYSTLGIITSRIQFVDSILLSDDDVREALKLTADIDENDTLFVALANHVQGMLWTGDKKLLNGLKRKGFDRIISTEDLYEDYLKRR